MAIEHLVQLGKRSTYVPAGTPGEDCAVTVTGRPAPRIPTSRARSPASAPAAW
jgi:hypothetical protein